MIHTFCARGLALTGDLVWRRVGRTWATSCEAQQGPVLSCIERFERAPQVDECVCVLRPVWLCAGTEF